LAGKELCHPLPILVLKIFTCWVGYIEAGISRFTADGEWIHCSTQTSPDELKDDTIRTILVDNNSDVWLDGGWGVDAILGKQSREHGDVDIVVQQKDALKLRKLLKEMRYQEVKRDDISDWNFVL